MCNELLVFQMGGALSGGVLKDALGSSLGSGPGQDGADGDEPDEDIPAYLLELLQNHRNHQQVVEGDFILGYHDDYRERYDGFDQPPPFRQRHKPRDSSARSTARASDLEISEEEAFSTRVFVTTPRRQR